MKRSSDLGQTWGELQVIIDNGPDTAGNQRPYSTAQLEDSGSPTAPTPLKMHTTEMFGSHILMILVKPGPSHES